MAHVWHDRGREEMLLDIDKRFAYLPKYEHYDVTAPHDVEGGSSQRAFIVDPPFFNVPIETVRKGVDRLTGGDTSVVLLLAFLTRAEWRVRTAFEGYNLQPTNFKLQYASIKPNKCSNFTLYSNVDLPGIRRRMPSRKKKKKK